LISAPLTDDIDYIDLSRKLDERAQIASLVEISDVFPHCSFAASEVFYCIHEISAWAQNIAGWAVFSSYGIDY